VRGVLFDVYNALGPMLRESFYRDAVIIGLQRKGIRCDAEKRMVELERTHIRYDYIQELPIRYDEHLLGQQSVNLILVDEKILLAIFAQKEPENAMAQHLKARLRHLGLQLGMLVNFYDSRLAMTYIRLS